MTYVVAVTRGSWSALAALGHLAWLAGNVRESRTSAIERWAARPPRSVLGRGSPVRYYLAVVPLTVVATAAAFQGARSSDERRLVTAAAVSSAGAMAVTVILVRSVNLSLFRGVGDAVQRDHLIRRWYRLNRVRVALLAGSTAALVISTLTPPRTGSTTRRGELTPGSDCVPRGG